MRARHQASFQTARGRANRGFTSGQFPMTYRASVVTNRPRSPGGTGWGSKTRAMG
jgi:hypothetical protein